MEAHLETRATTIHDVLASLRDAAMDERHKGDLFEGLIASYLRTDPVYRTRFSDVWRWMDWPDRDGKADTGIDLVAKDRETGELCAIQCKFYAEDHHLQKGDLDSFFTASGKAGFTTRMVISTTDSWSTHAEDALENQQIPVSRLRVQDLDESNVDWSQFVIERPGEMALRERKALRPHQRLAVDKVRAGFQDADRGKLIMACGTGKTFTSLKLMEEQVPVGGTVLFLVPSISLLSQTLREWSSEAEVPLRPFAVCSDVRAGRRTASEDIGPYDLAFPASTDTAKLLERFNGPGRDAAINVVFSTYQSLQVVANAQEAGLPTFDLVICDEAHRTTGVTLADEDESNFVLIHKPDYVKADKRLYMTATPRIYDDASKAKAGEGSAMLASMDDEAVFGDEFHRLGFGDAVAADLLSDYKVLVLAVDEGMVAKTFQQQLASDNELSLDDAAKIVGCWNGLSKRGVDVDRLHVETTPMRRAVAFAKDIKTSKRIADLFGEVTYKLVSESDEQDALQCEAEHVDGTFNVLRRNEKLDWLKEDVPDRLNVCRVLSNARCLSEGVDVPALDAVMFLNPRNSVVDVVQSVGRVMRKAEGKEYGYVILPIGVPAGVPAEEALRDNKRYQVVWQVLQALRAHDDRFNAMINKIDLNQSRDNKLQVIGVDGGSEGGDGGDGKFEQQAWGFTDLGEWKDAIYAKIVKKVGQRTYWEDWAKSVADIAERQTTRIRALLDDPEAGVQLAFEDFLVGLRGNLNDSITRDDAVDMLAQHLITKPVFDALFEDYSFAAHNPVSLVMEGMLKVLEEQNLQIEMESLDEFYESVRMRAAGIDNAAGKQRIITELYERFFTIAFKKTAESLGIVYTPIQVVDFILRSVEHMLQTEFGVSISNEDVHVLDPFTGTGTFIVRLLESGLIQPDDLLRKYASELHANELLLLAYYIAAINIEATFHGLVAEGKAGENAYTPFTGIVLTDTFQLAEADDSMDSVIFPVNNERAERQKGLDIRVVIGNPPYSSGQTSQNDSNQNLKYPTLDRAIADTYAARSTAKNKNSLYDSYIRAIRWASDRITDNGVIGFVTNGGYIDGNTADGLRQCLVDEFSSIYVYNLRGNQRTAGELSRKEGGKIFGSGSRTSVAVLLLVKKPGGAPATLKYRDIGDYLSREEKLQIVADSTITNIDWQTIVPHHAGDWINHRDERFETWRPIGAKEDGGSGSVFYINSRGLSTGRDAWNYSFSKAKLEHQVLGMVEFHTNQVDDFDEHCRAQNITNRKEAVADFIDLDPTKFNWNVSDKARVVSGTKYAVDKSALRVGMYRPFCKQYVCFDPQLNDRIYKLGRIFPTANHSNVGICLTAAGSHHEFTPLMVDMLPNLHLLDTGQVFPRYSFEPTSDAPGLFDEGDDPDFAKRDNISDEVLAEYRGAFGPDVTGDDVFYYVYALLHAPDYRHKFEADLNRMLPRIPRTSNAAQFQALVNAGRDLADLHLNFESQTPFEMHEQIRGGCDPTDPATFRVAKMRFGKNGKDADRSTIVYNANLTLSGIPDEAFRYMLGPRSAIEWIMDRYQVRTDKASGIVNDPNDWSFEHDDPRYIVDLLKRVVTVSVETMKIVDAMPALELAD